MAQHAALLAGMTKPQPASSQPQLIAQQPLGKQPMQWMAQPAVVPGQGVHVPLMPLPHEVIPGVAPGGHPVKPFMRWAGTRRAQVRAAAPHLAPVEVDSLLGAEWQRMDAAAQAPWVAQYEAECAQRGTTQQQQQQPSQEERREKEKAKEAKREQREREHALKQEQREAEKQRKQQAAAEAAALKQKEQEAKSRAKAELQAQKQADRERKAAEKEKQAAERAEERRRRKQEQEELKAAKQEAKLAKKAQREAQREANQAAKGAKKRKRAVEEEEDFFEVEQVVDRRTRVVDGEATAQYLVKWRGYPEGENTWEDEHNLEGSQACVAAFLAKERGLDQVELCESWYKELEQAGLEGCLRYFTEDVTLHAHGPSLSGVYTGREQLRLFFSRLAALTDTRELCCDQDSFFHDVVKMTVHVTGLERGFLKTADRRAYLNQFDHTFWFNQQGKVFKFRVNWNTELPEEQPQAS